MLGSNIITPFKGCQYLPEAALWIFKQRFTLSNLLNGHSILSDTYYYILQWYVLLYFLTTTKQG
jgi:hypothetical protein